MTFLTGLGAITVLAAVLPLVALFVGRRRADRVRTAIGLAPPSGQRFARPVAVAAAIAVLGLAAAQPALKHDAHVRVRTDAQALFVLDVSRSMAASATPRSPTRLDRAVAAAVRLRSAISDVPSGVATLTDRVLPDLAPVPSVATFDEVATRGVAIESPPPAGTDVRATTFAALRDIEAGNFFEPKTRRRLVVLLTDGESNPVDPGAIAQALPAREGYRFLSVRLWGADESVFTVEGRAERAYRPDALGRVVLVDLARALGGRAFDEAQVADAAAYLRRAAGTGPTSPVSVATPTRTPLAPYLAGVALLLLMLTFTPLQKGRSAVQSAVL
jgi:hypothetical protein